MKYFSIAFLVALLGFSASVSADTREIRGVDVPEEIRVGDDMLTLNGGERRRRWMMNLYVGSLYLLEPSSDAEAIIQADEPMAITMHITSGMINRDRMVDSIEEGFEASTGGDTEAVQGHIDELLAAFNKDIEKGDLVELIYSPETGVQVKHNGEEVGKVKGDMAFKEALFGIWLGENAVQDSLRKGMLGQ